MSKQDKATTERFTRTLRELVKRPENKVCADCKRNDPRWASWNIGVFLCIRCSGIHRGMGTHISRVKSVDLDTWTPEQMESVQKWGNNLANLYWEAHLKPGHIPPDHKMESFIRSKYESKRWALDGPPPADPSILVNQVVSPAQTIQQQAALPPSVASLPSHQQSSILSGRPPVTVRQSEVRELISTNYTATQRQSKSNDGPGSAHSTVVNPPSSHLTQPRLPENDLFSLDFHAPLTSSSAEASSSPAMSKKDIKQDILSLFSSAPVSSPLVPGQHSAQTPSPWGDTRSLQYSQQPQLSGQGNQQQPISMVGTSGIGAWGASSGWSGVPTVTPAQSSPWENFTPTTNQQQQANLFNTNAVWGSSASAALPTQHWPSPPLNDGNVISPKKDDVFGDLWGGFK